MTTLRTSCCIVGGGPAGMMLGVLLARAGVPVVVLEKHGDFLRDFRGDTVHPSTLQAMHDLGALGDLLARPHEELREVRGEIGGEIVHIGDFTHLPTDVRFMALMPQWDFLDVLAGVGRRYPTFDLRMEAEVTGLFSVAEDGAAGGPPDGTLRVTGVKATTPDGPLHVEADLVVGADGRTSIVRTLEGLRADPLGAPMDVLWMRLPRHADDPEPPLGAFEAGSIFIMLPRTGYYQCGYVIPKGQADAVRARGLGAFRDDIARAAPILADRTDALASWDDVKTLTVTVDRLREWAAPGVLCIGDAAHAMSPIGGVGINLAIQDAIAAANLLWEPLATGTLTTDDLHRVQRRRQWPVDAIQRLQLFLQTHLVAPALDGKAWDRPPLPARLVNEIPFLRRLPARLIGMGVRMERVHSPEVPA